MKTWDIFCRVIDNYGDIGVCWRLARQLAHEHHVNVRLWVDDIPTLKSIWPETLLQPQQNLAGVNVCQWVEDFQVDYIADVVIEVFACNIPDVYVRAMAQASTPPVWLNLEYLSAESWVEGCHLLDSIHPQNGLRKTFFFPGFTEKTGGLLREQTVLSQRDDFLAGTAKEQFLRSIGVVADGQKDLLLSLFSYENKAIESLLNSWSESTRPLLCLIPVGKTLVSVNEILKSQLAVGDSVCLGALTLQVIPFLTQLDYDRLLWACDINFVRGEDSFIRAQWAGKPFVWHIYPQEEEAHLVKLSAFLEKYTQAMGPELSAAVDAFWFRWNRGEDCKLAWDNLFSRSTEWHQHSQLWTKKLSSSPDLAANLVLFCQKIL